MLAGTSVVRPVTKTGWPAGVSMGGKVKVKRELVNGTGDPGDAAKYGVTTNGSPPVSKFS